VKPDTQPRNHLCGPTRSCLGVPRQFWSLKPSSHSALVLHVGDLPPTPESGHAVSSKIPWTRVRRDSPFCGFELIPVVLPMFHDKVPNLRRLGCMWAMYQFIQRAGCLGKRVVTPQTAIRTLATRSRRH
jgi:hypothetical protein